MKKPRGKFYKVTSEDGHCLYSGDAKPWSLPKGKKPGQWRDDTDKDKELSLCENGLHICRKKDVYQWVCAPSNKVWEVEVDWKKGYVKDENKVAVRRCRLVRRAKEFTEKKLSKYIYKY